ncbi:DUF6790 family protein [Microbacterium sp. 10M-3C3]|jgi:hypothetical protein|uniref:DUF6790 family protein n=1 Tax=Microbacterium sp. 10M-3C3 TaxID=2483401 RepID=UPI000F634B99|nr:DUF6790 family protein [Microbacterium sp. 10M-3C3]
MSAEPAASTRTPVILGLLPFGGVVLFVIAEIVAFVATGGRDFLQTTVMNAVLFLIGSAALGAAIAHLFFGPAIARSIGWQPGPFQFEVGAANAAIGVSAIVVGAAFGPDAWLGPILAALVFLVLAGIGHIRDIVKKRNFSINNAGPILFLDFLAPIVTLALWIWLTAS